MIDPYTCFTPQVNVHVRIPYKIKLVHLTNVLESQIFVFCTSDLPKEAHLQLLFLI